MSLRTTYDDKKDEHWLKAYTIDCFSRYKLVNDPVSANETDITERVDEMVNRLVRWGK